MYVLVELAFTFQTIVALSAKLTKATTEVHTECHYYAYLHSIFYWGFATNKKICETSGKIISLKLRGM